MGAETYRQTDRDGESKRLDILVERCFIPENTSIDDTKMYSYNGASSKLNMYLDIVIFYR